MAIQIGGRNMTDDEEKTEEILFGVLVIVGWLIGFMCGWLAHQ
jgi:hypothetical protein